MLAMHRGCDKFMQWISGSHAAGGRFELFVVPCHTRSLCVLIDIVCKPLMVDEILPISMEVAALHCSRSLSLSCVASRARAKQVYRINVLICGDIYLVDLVVGRARFINGSIERCNVCGCCW